MASTQNRPIKLLDIGCGSGRLHLRYGAKTIDMRHHREKDALVRLKKSDHALMHDPLLESRLDEVYGIDFSHEMIQMAKRHLEETGLFEATRTRLVFDEGSAFELKPEPSTVKPIAICLVNSIGVMQGERGAKALFQAMRRSVEEAGGVAIISCYRKEYLSSYGLNQYESTMDVSGQPSWLVPDQYAGRDYIPLPHGYKRAFDVHPGITVSIFTRGGELVAENYLLERDPKKTKETLDSGHIRTHWEYESNWYAFEKIDSWINKLWEPNKSYHFKSKVFDSMRGRPAQLALYDPSDSLREWVDQWADNY